MYPEPLRPTGREEVQLPSEGVILIPKATPSFRRWPGPPPVDTYGGKPIVILDGEPLFAELAILRLLRAVGWEGVWIDTYRNKRRVGMDEYASLPPDQEALLQRIYQASGTRSGCFDVFCWREGAVLFAESKRKGYDSIRPTQVRWLSSALGIRLPVEAFLIVEWSLTDG